MQELIKQIEIEISQAEGRRAEHARGSYSWWFEEGRLDAFRKVLQRISLITP